jgi:acyl-CoA synthetase (AMP-forming)/AMP-acid ligase II/short-subunit dehydrogenase involved in D-alanine esterification of teichoic acids/acyl carrier protein
MRVEARDDTISHVAEIEAVLRRLPQVQEAVVVVREFKPGDGQLVAYVVPEGSFHPKRLHAHLESVFLQGLVPMAFVPVSSLPLTGSGQVDKQVLDRLGVIDSDVVREWEERLRSVPGIDQVAVVVEEDIEPTPPLHLSDLLPGWKSASVRDIENPSAAPAQVQSVQASAGPKALAISHGGPLRKDAGAPTTLPAALERAARESPERGVVYIQSDGTDIFQSYPALLEEAERILAGLRSFGLKPQDKVLFQLERNQDFIPAFWGCQLGGFVPVPISIAPTYTSVNSAVSKLYNAWQMLDRPLVLTSKRLTQAVGSLSDLLNLQNFEVRAIDDLLMAEPDRNWHDSQRDDLALLMLTSGSTGMPKGVMLNHHNLLCRSAGSAQMNGFSSLDVTLNWMPLDHVAGIIYFHLRDVYLGCQQIHGPSESVLQDPLKWLDWIDRYRVSITFAPNFAYGLVNDRAVEVGRRGWDLASMRYVLNGAEAIVAKTARRFIDLLRPYGLASSAMHPAWGMSETSSGVTYSDSFSLDLVKDDDAFVEVGAPIPGFSMRMVDAQDHVVEEGVIGRLQVKGSSVMSGYYRNPVLTREVFTADGWFITGDLGLLRGGRLTITGREKDVIVIHGANYYSHEIEAVVDDIKDVETSYTAACAVRDDQANTDKLAIFFHPISNNDAHLILLLKAIRENVVKKVGIHPHYLVPVEKKDIPKTAIGKIQHSELSQRFKAGEFDPVVKRVDVLSGNANTIPAWFYRKVWHRKQLGTLRKQRELRPSLVFLDRPGLGVLLCEEMKRLNWPSIGVEPGSDFAKLASDRYRINPQDPEHYRRLLAGIAADGTRIEQVLHLWTCDSSAGDISSAEELERSQVRGVYSLLFLVQALTQGRENSRPLDLQVISTCSQCVLPDDGVAYEKGPVLGFLRTVPQEIPWVNCGHVDLPADDARVNAARILAEIQTASRDREVAYRHGERWIPRLQRVDFLQQEKRELPFKHGGMYLLSGGLGGIGVEIAKYLLKQYEAKLLLVGRTPLAPTRSVNGERTNVSGRIKAYRELQQLPGEIHYEAVDVGELAALRQAVEQARSRWRCDLDGVIHLAGIYQERLLTEETRETFAGVLRPKVRGTWALSQLLEDKPDKVFISFSSLNSFFGGALVGAYSAANSFLDCFTQHQRRKHSVKSYCFGWSMWDELGMSRGYPMKELTRSRGYYAISKRQGLYSLLAALHHDQPHVLVGLYGSNPHIRQHTDTDSYRMQTLCAYFTPKANEESGDRLKELFIQDRFGTRIGCDFRQVSQLPQTDTGEIDREKLARLRQRPDQSPIEPVAPQTELERRIADFWQEVLPIPQVGIHDNFFELGGNSLLATQIASRIQDAFKVHLSLRMVLEQPTVAKLALAVQRHLEEEDTKGTDAIEKVETGDAKRILARLDQLSDEEVHSLLSKTLAQDEKQ